MNPAELERVVRARRLCRDGTLRAIRLSAGLSLREFAAGVPTTHVSVLHWEAGAASPTPANALRLLDVIDALLNGSAR